MLPQTVKSQEDTAREAGHNALAVISLVLGLIGIPSMAADPAFGLLYGIAAIVAGMIGLRRSRIRSAGRGLAIAGITFGAVTLVAFAILVFLISRDALGGTSAPVRFGGSLTN